MSRAVVGMITSYSGITYGDWLWHQTPEPFGQWRNIQLRANAPQPDYLVLYHYNFWPQTQVPRPHWMRWRRSHPPQVHPPDLRGVPKERIMYLMREPPLPEIVEKNQTDYRYAAEFCGYVSGPDEYAPHPDVMPAIWYHGNRFQDLTELGIPDKCDRCSWVTSGIDRSANHRQRMAFLRQVQSSYLDVAVYGRNLPPDIQSHGELKNKWNGMAPYYYNLAIENYADNQWYVSEKLWDALLAWCLPLYYGGSAADRLLPPGSFLRLPSLDQQGIDWIREITATPDAWYAAKDAIAEARQIILHRLNLMNWLSDRVNAMDS